MQHVTVRRVALSLWGLIGLAREGRLAAGERVLFLHTGGLPSLHEYENVVLGQSAVAAR